MTSSYGCNIKNKLPECLDISYRMIASYSGLHEEYAGLTIMASHRTFSGQNKHMSGQIKFGQTNLLYIINENFTELIENNDVWTNFGPDHKH